MPEGVCFKACSRSQLHSCNGNQIILYASLHKLPCHLYSICQKYMSSPVHFILMAPFGSNLCQQLGECSFPFECDKCAKSKVKFLTSLCVQHQCSTSLKILRLNGNKSLQPRQKAFPEAWGMLAAD